MSYREPGDNGMEYKESFWEKCRRTTRAIAGLVGIIWKIAIPIAVVIFALGFFTLQAKSCGVETKKENQENQERVRNIQSAARRWAQENPQLHVTPSTIICLDPIYNNGSNSCNLEQMACHAVKINGTPINLTCTPNGCFIPP